MMVSFCAVLFPRDVLDEILDLIESVSEGFPTYSYKDISSKFKSITSFLKMYYSNSWQKQRPPLVCCLHNFMLLGDPT